MKKVLFIVVVITLFLAGAVLTTKTAGYEPLVISAAGGETDLVAATGYNVGVPTPAAALAPKDLMRQNGDSPYNGVVLSCFATSNENDTVTMSIYGISIDGAPERIGSFVWTFGTAIRSSGVRWADTCVVTLTDTSSSNVVDVADSANNRIARARFDVTGFRYLYAIAHTTTTGAATTITVEMRPW